MKKVLFTLMLAALTACSNNEEGIWQANEVRLTSEIASMTRGTSLSQQSTQIVSGRQVGIYTVGAKSDQNNVAWTAKEDGALANTSETLYWGEGALTVTAYHPYNSGWTTASENMQFQVSTDQTDTGYLESDLLWAKQQADKAGETVKLKFAHKLAKINIKLKSFDENNLNGAVVSICGVRTAVSILPSDGTLKTVEADPLSIKAAVTSIETPTATAIIVPQTVAAGTSFIQIEVSGKTYFYKLPAEKTFESGNSYSYTLEIKESLKEVACTSENITDWNNAGEETGVAQSYYSQAGQLEFSPDIIELEYYGELNGDDIKVLRRMLGAGEFSDEEKGKLEVLDLSKAKIVEGGSIYFYDYSYCRTANNKITPYMFFNCKNLKKIILPPNITAIEHDAFRECRSLEFMQIPNGVTEIGDMAFWGCRLTEIIIPESVTSIGSGAFRVCPIAQVFIPNSVIEFGTGVFSSNRSLEEIAVNANHPIFTVVDGVLYNKDVTKLLQYPGKKTGINIPSTVKIIGVDAFAGSGITDLIIPEGVTTIEFGAFQNSSLSKISLPVTLTTIGEAAFYHCAFTDIVIPEGITILEEVIFQSNPKLKEITWGSKVTQIKKNAFYGVPLEIINSKSAIPPTLDKSWAGYSEKYGNEYVKIDFATAKVYVPKGCVEAYKNSDWKVFTNIFEME